NVVNGFLDYLLVSKTTLGISGAAYATVISQILSALACFVYMQKKHPGLKLSRDDFTFVPDIFRELMSSGFSMSVMVSFVQFGSVALQTSINTFGQNIIVAHIAARKSARLYDSVLCFRYCACHILRPESGGRAKGPYQKGNEIFIPGLLRVVGLCFFHGSSVCSGVHQGTHRYNRC
ncbi:MAG: polysaccharide biosynthesis C-terminal domain-containing protein, partial [Prevotellaceae bacterium]|nr:polysaccharide biosynthesis C-terminal domain-containing protein [Candidatus Colivivens equi]